MVRKAYLKRIESRIEGWSWEIANLAGRADKAEGEAKTLYREQLKVLRSKQEAARERIEELRNAGADTWGKFKGGVEEALDDLKKAVDNAVSKLKKSA